MAWQEEREAGRALVCAEVKECLSWSWGGGVGRGGLGEIAGPSLPNLTSWETQLFGFLGDVESCDGGNVSKQTTAQLCSSFFKLFPLLRCDSAAGGWTRAAGGGGLAAHQFQTSAEKQQRQRRFLSPPFFLSLLLPLLFFFYTNYLMCDLGALQPVMQSRWAPPPLLFFVF